MSTFDDLSAAADLLAAEAARLIALRPAPADAASARRARRRGAFVAPVGRGAIFERDGWVCGLCRQPIDPALAWPDPMSASIDHVRAIARGGTHEPGNVQAAHLACNIRKGAGGWLPPRLAHLGVRVTGREL